MRKLESDPLGWSPGSFVGSHNRYRGIETDLGGHKQWSTLYQVRNKAASPAKFNMWAWFAKSWLSPWHLALFCPQDIWTTMHGHSWSQPEPGANCMLTKGDPRSRLMLRLMWDSQAKFDHQGGEHLRKPSPGFLAVWNCQIWAEAYDKPAKCTIFYLLQGFSDCCLWHLTLHDPLSGVDQHTIAVN